jgi:hypothetical protein
MILATALKLAPLYDTPTMRDNIQEGSGSHRHVEYDTFKFRQERL